jgi:hypothetical protein
LSGCRRVPNESTDRVQSAERLPKACAGNLVSARAWPAKSRDERNAALQVVTLRHARTGRLSAVNASAFVSFAG